MAMGGFGGHGHTGRIEDFRFLTGTGRYVDDIHLANMTCAHVVRSPVAHAAIRSIDITRAESMPGVIAVLTGADLDADGIGTIPCVSRPRKADFSVQAIIEPPYRALALDRVRMVGEGVALVVAKTLAIAKDAGEAVDIDYEHLPPVVGLQRAVAPDAPRLWPEAPGNVSFTYEIGDGPGVRQAIKEAAHVTRLIIDINRVSATPLEPRAALGDFDPGTGRYTLHVGHQTPHQARHVLATRIFHVPEHRVRVISPDVGGGFGLKAGLFAEDILVLWAARRTGRPVKWLCERGEAFLSDDHARENLVRAALALDGDGRFLGLEYDALANLGACVSLRGAHPPTNNLGSLSGPYTTPAIFPRARRLYQHPPDVVLSGRGAARGDLCPGAADQRGRRRNGHRSLRVASAQPHPRQCDAVQDQPLVHL